MMMEDEKQPLIPERLLTVKRFREDLKFFLSLPSDVMASIARLANDSEGFHPQQKASTLSQQTSLSQDDARRMLATSNYFYDRVTGCHITPKDAVQTLLTLATEFGVKLSEDQRHALEGIFDYKPAYEKGRYAVSQVLQAGPHYISLDGEWSIRICRTRQNEPVKVPVLSSSLAWHDGQGNDHEAFLQMTLHDWAEFKAKVDKINRDLEDLRSFLE